LMAEFAYQDVEAWNTGVKLAASVGRLKIGSNLKASSDAQAKAFEQAGLACALIAEGSMREGGAREAPPRPGNGPAPATARPRRRRTTPGGGAAKRGRPTKRPTRAAAMNDPMGVGPSGKKRILTGIRPTGPLHLGHYAGALENWLRLQREYECYFLIADYQVSDFADDISRVRDAVWEVALDWLAVGLDPEDSSFVIESLVPEHTELSTWLAWFLPVGMLERNPTLKAEMEAIENPEDGKTRGRSGPVAFYTSPVMQVANILMPRAHLVPVGEDQLPHIELTRETARRFNREFKP